MVVVDFMSTKRMGIPGQRGTFTVTEIDPSRGRGAWEFTAYMTKPPIVTAGYGGWSRVARPRKKAITEWVGRDSASITIEFMLDTLDEDDGMYVRTQERALEHLAGLDEDDPEPPLVRLSSVPEALIPHNEYHAGHVKWFVDTLTWSADAKISNRVGNPVRIAGTVVLTQHVADHRLESLTSAAKRRRTSAKKGSKRKTYTVKTGDTLGKIAARKDVYGDASGWPRIAKANGIRDPKSLKVGQVLKIP